jgi:hypothetical protein
MGWDQDGSYGNYVGECDMDSSGTGQELVAGFCEHSDEASGSDAHN